MLPEKKITSPEDRIEIIRSAVKKLYNIKHRPLDLTRNYELDTLLYCAQAKKFGRVTANSQYYITLQFRSGESKTYFRRSGWKPCKEQFLKDNYLKMTNRALAKALDCTEKVVEKKLSELDLKRNFKWTPEHDAFLVENRHKKLQWLSDQLHTSKASIKGRLYRLKQKGVFVELNQRQKFQWTDEDDAFLITHMDRSNQWFAEHYGIKVSTVKTRFKKLREQGKITQYRKRGKKKGTK